MSHGIVTAGHEKTAEAATEILKGGGNAFDAVVAGGFAACVAESVLASLGGGGFLMAHSEDKHLERVYDFFVQTPKRVPHREDLDFFPIEADFGPATQEFHIGLGSVATPGMIAGLFAIHRDLGSLPISEVLTPAIRLCRDGVPINDFQEYLFTVVSSIYSSTPEARRIFGSRKQTGKLVKAGESLQYPNLADTLEAMIHEGSDLFYRGEIAQRIADQCRKGGTLGLEDLENYEVHRHKPLEFYYRGHRLLTNPPPSCGGILIAFTLQLLDVPETQGLKFGSAEDLYQLAHAMGLTNKARLDALSENADWPAACQVLLDTGFLEQYRKEIPERPAALRGTTHLNVIDGQGNLASMSLSNGEGCGHIIPGTDIMLNNMLGEEDLNPEGFHLWKPDLRMSSMMSPTLLFHRNGARLATGSGGSNRIRTAIVQVLKNITDHKMSVRDAVSAPRIHFERELLSVEPGFEEKVEKILAEIFPRNHFWDEKNLFFGGVHTAEWHPQEGFSGQGDPRRYGVAMEV